MKIELKIQRSWPVVVLALTLIPFAGWASDAFRIGEPVSVAGGGLGDGGPALSASVLPLDVLAAPDGRILIADEQFNRVRAVSVDGRISTVVGSGRYRDDDGFPVAALASSLRVPAGMALSPDGSLLYVVDLGNRRISVVEADGALRTFVGPEHPLFATVPGEFAPAGVAVGPEGKVHVADRGQNVVWQFEPEGRQAAGRKVAGNGTRGFGGDGGPSALGQVADPRAVVVGSDGSIYVADFANRRVRKVGPDGRIQTVAGNGREDPWGGISLPALAASLKPVDVALDRDGRLLILDGLENRVLRLRDGQLLVVARLGEGSEVTGLSVDGEGRILVADAGLRRVLALEESANGFEAAVVAVAGNGSIRASGDGQQAENASLYQPFGMSYDDDGNLYLVDRLNHLVRRILVDGRIERIAGTGVAGFSGDGGPALEAALNKPTSVAVGPDGVVFVADAGNHRIRAIDTSGRIVTVAGTGEAMFAGDGGPAVESALSSPAGLSLDWRGGGLLIADSGNGRIRRLHEDGTISTVAGSGSTWPVDDGGPPLESPLLWPVDVRADRNGRIFIADAGAHRVYRLGEDGLLWVVAGTGEAGLGADGSAGPSAALNRPLGIEPDGAGGLFIADSGNQRVLHLDADGLLRELATSPGQPTRLARSPAGGLLYSDSQMHRIFRLPLERLWPPSSQRVRLADAGAYTLETIAALTLPGLLDVVADPALDRVYATHRKGVLLISGDGEREFVAHFAARDYSAVPVPTTGGGWGLAIGTPGELGRDFPLTRIEQGPWGPRYKPILLRLEGADALARNAPGDLFIHQRRGRVLRLAGAAGGDGRERDLTNVDLEEYAALPAGQALLAVDARGRLVVALVESLELLRVEDTDRDGKNTDFGELRRVAQLSERPVALAAGAGGSVYVATSGGRIFRMPGGDGAEMTLFADGFAPGLLGISVGAGGALYALEGDESGGRLIRITPAAPKLAVWPQVLSFAEQPVGQRATRTVVLRNDGGLPLVAAAEITGAASLVGWDGEIQLEPGEAQAFEVTIVPVAKGRTTDELVWRDRGRGGDVLLRLPVEVTGVAPELRVAAGVDLGTVWVGGAGTSVIGLTNTGSLPLEILGLEVSGEMSALGTAVFAATGGPFEVALDSENFLAQGGGEGEILVTLRPRERGDFESTLFIHTNDPVTPVRAVRLTGAGGRAQLTLPEVLDLGVARVGQRLRRRLELKNEGELDLEIDGVLTGTGVLIATTRRLLVKAGETGVLELEFRPLEPGSVEGVLTLLTNDPRTPEWKLPFLGRGVSSLLEVSEAVHDFESTALGQTRRWVLTVKNLGSRPVRIGSVKSDGRQFNVVGETPFQLAPGATGVIAVEFRPTRLGVSTATLTLRTDLGEARAVKIQLVGRGLVASRLEIGTAVIRDGEEERGDETVWVWPGEEVALPILIEEARQLRGLAMSLALPSEEMAFAGLAFPAASVFAGGQLLVVERTDREGLLELGVALTGQRAAEGVSGSGLIGLLRLKVGRLRSRDLEVALTRVVYVSSTGQADTVATPESSVSLNLRLKGDFDGDGRLGLMDFFSLAEAAASGALPDESAGFDLDRDGVLGAGDIRLLLLHMRPEIAAKAVAQQQSPKAVALLPPYPNPFNAAITLGFVLPREEAVQLVVFNMIGQQVRQLVATTKGAGMHQVAWDGRDQAGRPVKTGVYFAVLSTPEVRKVERVILLR